MSEEKKKPELLDALAFAALDGQALIGRLAALYIKAEEKLKKELNRRARNEYEVNEKHISKWMRPIYTPPFGKVRETIAAVLAEVIRQKEVHAKRETARAYIVTYTRRLEKSQRRNAVASHLYAIKSRHYREAELTPDPVSCSIICSCNDHLILVDGTSSVYGRGVFLFTLNRKTGKSQFVKLKDRFSLESKDLPGVLFKIAPPEVRVSLFSGLSVVADFDKLAFVVGEESKVVPFDTVGDVVVTQGFTPPVYETKS